MKRIQTSAILLAAVLGGPSAVYADYPDRPIHIIVPLPAGSSADAVARIVLPAAERILGQPFVIENEGGAGAIAGAERASKADTDGYNLFWGTTAALSANPNLYESLPYSPDDFTGITRVSAQSLIMAVPTVSGIDSVSEFVDEAASGNFLYGSPGIGTAAHLCGEMLIQDTGIEMRHIPYQAGPQSVLDLMRGELSTMFYSLAQFQPGIQSGELRLLAIAAESRSKFTPDLPTFHELGYEVQATVWYGLFARSGTPDDRIAKVAAAMEQVLHDPEIVTALEATGTEVWPTASPADFNTFLAEERASYHELTEAAGLEKR